jgi:hypothetical protein
MYSFRISWHSSGPEAWQLYHIGTRPVRRDIPSLVVTSQSCMPASWAGEGMPNHSFQSWGVRTTRRSDRWTRRSSFGVWGRNCPLPGSAEWVVLPSFSVRWRWAIKKCNPKGYGMKPDKWDRMWPVHWIQFSEQYDNPCYSNLIYPLHFATHRLQTVQFPENSPPLRRDCCSGIKRKWRFKLIFGFLLSIINWYI